MLQIIKGDLLEADVFAICHQVNCQNVMGAGLAKAIATKWPKVKVVVTCWRVKVDAVYQLLSGRSGLELAGLFPGLHGLIGILGIVGQAPAFKIGDAFGVIAHRT